MKEKSDVKVEEIDAKGVDYTRQVTVEFDSNTHGPWTFEPKILRDGASRRTCGC